MVSVIINLIFMMGSGGQAIFPTFSFMSHSCVPNCAHSVFPNKTLALQAKHKIRAGEEFTIAYISPLQGSLKRRMKLHDKWFFDCGCPRCQSPTELDSFTSVHLCQVCMIFYCISFYCIVSRSALQRTLTFCRLT